MIELLGQLKINGIIKLFSDITFAAFSLGNALAVIITKMLENHQSNPQKKKIGRFFGKFEMIPIVTNNNTNLIFIFEY